MVLTRSIYGTYGWQPGNVATLFHKPSRAGRKEIIIIINIINMIKSNRNYLPSCQVATSERQVNFHVVVEDDAFLTGSYLLLLAAIYTIITT